MEINDGSILDALHGPSGPEISAKEIKTRVSRIVRWAESISQELKEDHMLQSLALEALLMLVGPGALHSNEEFKSPSKRDWAIDLLIEAVSS